MWHASTTRNTGSVLPYGQYANTKHDGHSNSMPDLPNCCGCTHNWRCVLRDECSNTDSDHIGGISIWYKLSTNSHACPHDDTDEWSITDNHTNAMGSNENAHADSNVDSLMLRNTAREGRYSRSDDSDSNASIL